jgi:hypothetical protein
VQSLSLLIIFAEYLLLRHAASRAATVKCNAQPDVSQDVRS